MHPSGQCPSFKGRIDCFGSETFDLPFLVRIEDDQICGSAFRDTLTGQMVEGGRILAHFAHQLQERQVTRFDKFCDAKGQGGLQADDAAGGFGQGLTLLIDAVGRMICGNHVDGAVLQSFDDGLPVSFRPEGRIHFRQGTIGQNSLIRQGEMMGSCLGGYMGTSFLGRPHCLHGSRRADVLDVHACTRSPRPDGSPAPPW